MTYWLVSFAVFWGVWLLVPLLVDGATALLGLSGVVLRQLTDKRASSELAYYPFVTVIVPVFNSAQTLEKLLRSISNQSYPRGKMEIILVDNGSVDHSYEVFLQLTELLQLNMYWHSIPGQGKSWALNAGIHLAKGDYVFNIDSDVFLANDAIFETVAYLESEPEVGAVTGLLIITPETGESSPGQRVLAGCEFFEYLAAFGVGRSYQSYLRALYTLSGAYSVFRKAAITGTFLYNKETVSEDTDLTFQLYERMPGYRIDNLTSAKVYLEPIASLAALYSQRVRWQRGQLEVSARHRRLLKRPPWALIGLTPSRALLIDHTLSFPRLIWLIFFPVLLIYDYSLSLLLGAYLLVYIFYLAVETSWYVAAYFFADDEIRRRVLEKWFLVPLMPMYRIMVFFFRFSGFLTAVAEPRTWQVPNPLEQLKAASMDLVAKIKKVWY